MTAQFRLAGATLTAVQGSPQFRLAGATLTAVQSGVTPAQFRLADAALYSVSQTLYFDGTSWVATTPALIPASGSGTSTVRSSSITLSGPVSASGSGSSVVTGKPVGPSFVVASGSGSSVVVATVTLNGVTVLASGSGNAQSAPPGSPTSGPPTVANSSYYLYTPPQYSMTGILQGSLRYSVNTSMLVYKYQGVWHLVEVAGVGTLDGAELYYDRPTIVPNNIANELAAFGQGTLVSLPGVVVTDNGNGTFTATGPDLIDNGDGTFTISGAYVVDNGDGTFTITL